jgi:superfamily II DNA/RNA helicase
VLIFVSTKRAADEVCDRLRRDGWPALAIHGDKEQPERDFVISEFKSGKSPILVASKLFSMRGASPDRQILTLLRS